MRKDLPLHVCLFKSLNMLFPEDEARRVWSQLYWILDV